MRTYLKKIRLSMDLSQQSVADQLSVSRQYYQQIESGDRQNDMGVTLAAKLAKVFNISVDRIIVEESKLTQESS